MPLCYVHWPVEPTLKGFSSFSISQRHPYLPSRGWYTSIPQSIPCAFALGDFSLAPGATFWKRQSHRGASGKGPWTSSDTHISYYAVRAFLFSTHYLVNVDTAGVYQKMLLYVVKHIIVIKNWAIVMLNHWLLLFHRHSQLNQISNLPYRPNCWWKDILRLKIL